MSDPSNLVVPPKRTYFLNYMGHLNVHNVYIKPMLQWVVAEIKFRRKPIFCSLSLEQEAFTAKKEPKLLIDTGSLAEPIYNQDSDISAFNHPLAPIDASVKNSNSSRGNCLPLVCELNQVAEVISPHDLEKNCIAILKCPNYPDGPYVCHVFQDEDKTLIKEVSETMNRWMTWHQKVSPPLGINGKDQDFDCVKFEAMMLGKIQVKQEFPPNTFIDEAIDKYRSLEVEHKMELKNVKRMSTDLPESPFSNGCHQLISGASLIDDSRDSAIDILRRNSSSILTQDGNLVPPNFDRQRCNSIDTPSSAAMKQRLRGRTRHCSEPGGTSGLGFDKNKIRLLLIGRHSITLICPDMSARKIEVQFTDITRCCKGIHNKDHFGIFAKDQHATQRNDDFKFRCYLFKCAEETVCDEILLALKQSCSMCAQGVDPLKTYHIVCKTMNQISGATCGQEWVEQGLNIAAKFISDNLTDLEQRAVKNKIEECCKSRQVEFKYEKLVVVMTVLRCLYLEKQHEHDMKLKQLKEPNSNAISKRLNFFKSRAKKSLSSFETFFEKGFQKMHELQHEAEHHISSPIEKLKFFGENPRTLSPGPTGQLSQAMRLRNRSGSPQSGTELSPLASRNHSCSSGEEPRPRSNTVGAVDQSSIMARRKLIMNDNMSEEKPQPHMPPSAFSPVQAKAANPALNLSNSSLKRTSFSSPFLRRLTHQLEDVQESPSEGANAVTLTPSRFSLTRLFGLSDQKAGQAKFKPISKGKVQELKVVNSEARVSPLCLPPTRQKETEEKLYDHVKESYEYETSDEEDTGIFFIAKSLHTTDKRASSPDLPHPLFSVKKEDQKVLPAGEVSTGVPKRTFSALFYNENGIYSECTKSLQEDVWPKQEDAVIGISSDSTPTQSRSPSPKTVDRKSSIASASTGKKMSFHQEIFIRVSGSSQKKKRQYPNASPALQNYMKPLSALKTPEDVRYAWKRAIRDQMMINRINNLTVVSNGDLPPNPLLKVKLDYREVGPICPEMDKVWMELLSTDNRNDYKIDLGVLQAAVKRGVSKQLRGQVWSLLHEQWKLRKVDNIRETMKLNVMAKKPYSDLLKALTPHQHAILIDLGRTFPTHAYFKQQLQNGQLHLFNLLKAYSLADADVGYCQGLSFVAGIILMHTNSPFDAFDILCHLMFDVGCRNLYLPDMEALRVAVYQLSRLLHDFHRDLYDHLERNDVGLMLFSTPWFLTMFASILSFGFTARIFDLLFLEGKSALFKAALSLLNHHKANILAEDSFESIVCYLKSNLIEMKEMDVQGVIKQMFELDIGDTLQVYEVEYAVLEDGEIFGEAPRDSKEPLSITDEMKHKITRLEHVNQTVTKYNLDLAEQLEAAQTQIKSLQQGLTDMVALDEKRSLELETVKEENRSMKRMSAD